MTRSQHINSQNDMVLEYDGHINTLNGRVSLIDPQPEQLHMEDIARGLAFKPHFGGHSKYFFSIAEHSLLVYDLANSANMSPYYLKVALLHDASEAYLGDMLKPLKVMQPSFVEVEDRFTEAIFSKFGLDTDAIKKIKKYDKISQSIEFVEFYETKEADLLYYYPPELARQMFLRRAKNLWPELNIEIE